MIEFEPWISGVGSDCSANYILYQIILDVSSQNLRANLTIAFLTISPPMRLLLVPPTSTAEKSSKIHSQPT